MAFGYYCNYNYYTGIQIFITPLRKSSLVSVLLTDPQEKMVDTNSITVKHQTKWC